MKRKTLLTLVGSICLIVVLVALLLPACAKEAPAPAPAPAPVMKWKLQCTWPANDLQWMECVPKLCDWVKERSDGRVEITPYSAGQLIKTPELFDGLSKGVVEMLVSCGTYWRGSIPVADIEFNLICGQRSQEDVYALMEERGLMDLLTKAYAEHNIHYLAYSPYTFMPVMSTKPIYTVDDFKGMKIRSAGMFADLETAMGASVVYIPGEEIYMALQLGTVDAASWSSQAVEMMKFHEVCKYYVVPAPAPPGTCLNQITGHVLVNMDAWNSLSADLKKVFTSAGEDYRDLTAKLYREWDEKWFSVRAKELGVTICIIPETEVEKMREIAMREIWPMVEKDAYCTQAIGIIKDYLRDEGALK